VSGAPGGVHQVVDVGIGAEAEFPAERVVCHADQLVGFKVDAFCPPCKFRWLDEFRVIVRALREQLEEVLCAENGQQVRLWVAIEGGEEDMPAWFDQRCAGGDDACGVRDVLEHFHASDDIERSCGLGRKVFDGYQAVINLLSAFQKVQPGDGQRFFGKVDSGDVRSCTGHSF